MEAGQTMSSQPEPDPGLSAVMSERRQLINLTYRLLGSLAEAEDAVQETYARWYAMSRQQQDAIGNPGAWLTTVAPRRPAASWPPQPAAASAPRRLPRPRQPGRPALSGT